MRGVSLEVSEPTSKYIVKTESLLIPRLELLLTSADRASTLRDLILSLALQGKLSDRREDDPPVALLMAAIASEKKQLASRGLIRANGTKEARAEVFDGLPQSWVMASLASLCSVVTDGDHLPPPKADQGVPFLVIGDIRAGLIDLSTAERFVPSDYFESLDWIRRPRAGDVLYTTVGSFGIPIAVTRDEDFCFQRHIALLRPGLLALQSYLLLALKSPFVLAQATRGATGIAQKTVSLAVLRSISLPLPPLAEQHRIG